jgi:hypothetical protein
MIPLHRIGKALRLLNSIQREIDPTCFFASARSVSPDKYRGPGMPPWIKSVLFNVKNENSRGPSPRHTIHTPILFVSPALSFLNLAGVCPKYNLKALEKCCALA